MEEANCKEEREKIKNAETEAQLDQSAAEKRDEENLEKTFKVLLAIIGIFLHNSSIRALILMGISQSGKTTVATAIAGYLLKFFKDQLSNTFQIDVADECRLAQQFGLKIGHLLSASETKLANVIRIKGNDHIFDNIIDNSGIIDSSDEQELKNNFSTKMVLKTAKEFSFVLLITSDNFEARSKHVNDLFEHFIQQFQEPAFLKILEKKSLAILINKSKHIDCPKVCKHFITHIKIQHKPKVSQDLWNQFCDYFLAEGAPIYFVRTPSEPTASFRMTFSRNLKEGNILSIDDFLKMLCSVDIDENDINVHLTPNAEKYLVKLMNKFVPQFIKLIKANIKEIADFFDSKNKPQGEADLGSPIKLCDLLKERH